MSGDYDDGVRIVDNLKIIEDTDKWSEYSGILVNCHLGLQWRRLGYDDFVNWVVIGNSSHKLTGVRVVYEV